MIEPIKIEVTGVTDKEAFCKLLSKEFDIPVVYEKKGKAMTTNLDWMYENDRKTLITMIEGDCCSCKFNANYCSREEYRCVREWLMAEYVEPDSWEKIKHDAMLMVPDYCRMILKWSDLRIYESEHSEMNEAVANDIINRCKKLAGVKE